jgi:alginate O-acetyltransferase complex protein AlgI
MGGNRRHQAVNIFVVWFLTGMWHGASWNFIIWGVYFGLIVMLEKYTILRIKDKIPSPVLHLYSLALVVIGWGIFYFDDFHSMQTFFNAFWGNAKVATDFVSESALLDNFWLWVAALLFCLPLLHVLSEFVERSCNERRVLKQSLFFVAHLSVSLVMLICSVALLVGATNNAFIYTRF